MIVKDEKKNDENDENIIVNDENFPLPRSGIRQSHRLCLLLFNFALDNETRENWMKKKSYLVGREVVKLFQSIVNMMYIENLKKTYI